MSEEAEIILKGKFEGGKLLVDVTEKIDGNIKKIGSSSTATEQNVSSLEKGLKKLAAIVGITYLTNQFKNLVAGSLRAAGSMEQVDEALTTMLGSAEKAANLQKDLIQFAKKTPFEIEGIFSTTKQLLAYGIAQEDIISTMRTLGNIASGVGVDMGRLALVFGQVRTTGKLLGQDLNQFTQAGVPLLAELAKLLGKTESEIIKMKESGAISFDLVQRALQNMTAEGGRFYNLMENQSKTFLGTVSNMADGFFQVKTALGNALLPAAKRFVNYIIPSLDNITAYIERNSASITRFSQAILTGLSYVGKGFKAVFYVLEFFAKFIENVTVAFYVFSLEITKGFSELKVVIFNFVSSVLNQLSLLSKLPMFGWIDEAKTKFSTMKDSVIGDIRNINNEIAAIKQVQLEGNIAIASSRDVPEIPVLQDSSATQTLTTVQDVSEVSDNDRLAKLKEENSMLLNEQKSFLSGYNQNQTEADKLLLENKILSRQQDLLSQVQFSTKKQELDKALLDNEISVEDYRKELQAVNNQARMEAIQEQFLQEFATFQENQTLLNETKLTMQETQDEAELMQLQLKLEQYEEKQKASNDRLVQLKIKKETEEAKAEAKADKFKKFMQSEGMQRAEQGASALIQLQNSKNKEIAAIGKAAAVFQITMDTARGAMSAYSALAMIPIVGPELGAMAAAAVIAYGAERLSTVKSNSFAVGTPNIPQDQMANVHKGEMIVPTTFSEAIRSGELILSGQGAMANNIMESGATITNININLDGATFVGKMSDEDITMIGERLGQLIAEDVIPSLPTN